jgi:HprK-related kinase A
VKISSIPERQLQASLRASGIWFPVGPFVVHLRSSIPSVATNIRLLYADSVLLHEQDFADFHIAIETPRGLRRWIKPQVNFSFDGYVPFKPLPVDQAYPLFEWGMNWCVGNFAHQYQLVHAAVVERDGHAAILPAPPGSGKSTLCAALINRGWRLLSDELALVSPATLELTPIPRPVSLKYDSIRIIGEYVSDACFGPVVRDTSKGTVSHLRAPEESMRDGSLAAMPAWIIFPRYVAGAPAVLAPRPKGTSLMEIADQSFNYNILGAEGFDTLSRLVDACACYDFSYSSLDEAIEVFDRLQVSTTAAAHA